MKELEEVKLKVLAMFESVQEARSWIEWVHQGSKPAETNIEKLFNIGLGAVTSHCAKCMNLGGCHFAKSKMPIQPLHPNCHCETKEIAQPIPKITAFASLPIEKLTKYAFCRFCQKTLF